MSSYDNESAVPSIKELAEAGEIAAIVELLSTQEGRTRNFPFVTNETLQLAIKRAGDRGFSHLTENGYRQILSINMLLLARVHLYIANRMLDAECARTSVWQAIPPDLVGDGWIDRAERIARFMMEVAASRARAQHVEKLGARNGEQTKEPGRDRGAMGETPAEAAEVPAPANAGRNGSAQRTQPRAAQVGGALSRNG